MRDWCRDECYVNICRISNVLMDSYYPAVPFCCSLLPLLYPNDCRMKTSVVIMGVRGHGYPGHLSSIMLHSIRSKIKPK